MQYSLRDIFRDVIDAAKEAGIWQTLSPGEKETVVHYFLNHFDAVLKEAGWQRLFRLMSSYAPSGRSTQRVQGGKQG